MNVLFFDDTLPVKNCVATIGFFDGVHLGHQAILEKLKSFSLPTVVITFQKHPQETLDPSKKISYLTSFEKKLSLLKKAGIDYVYVLPSDPAFFSLSYQEFLRKLQEKVPFSQLILGKGAAFGKNRLGREEALLAEAKKLGFSIQYLKQTLAKGEIISSTKIRHLLKEGKKIEAEKLLGNLHFIDSTP